MARTDNLTNFLTDIATAIRNKGGTSEQIQASDFDTAISNLPSGGGSSQFEEDFKTWIESNKTSSSSILPIPSNITSIGDYTFYDLSNLSLTSLSNEITSIGKYAFYGCDKLALTSLPDGITIINPHTFNSCYALALTSLPSGITSIGDGAFRFCQKITLTTLRI